MDCTEDIDRLIITGFHSMQVFWVCMACGLNEISARRPCVLISQCTCFMQTLFSSTAEFFSIVNTVIADEETLLFSLPALF